MTQEESKPVAYSWNEALRIAKREKYNTKVKLPKRFAGPMPRQFESSTLSVYGGANAVYRDQREEDSYQVREFDDHYTVEMDQFNPDEGRIVSHALADAPVYAFMGLVALGAVAAASS